MPVSRLDAAYRKLLVTKFFTKGWGSPEHLLKLFNFRPIMSNRDECYKLVPTDYPVQIINQEIRPNCRIIDGKFRSPLAHYLPGLLKPEIQDAYFQMVLPLKWPSKYYRPICIHLAGTGDHYFWRRRNIMAKPLLKHGIGAVILENPYYGTRKPRDQVRSSLHHVSDIFVMGGCLILECIVLLNWCESRGYGPLGVSGLSMGGHMASLAASNWPKPLVLVPCLSWSTASSVFTEGVMSESIDWDMLQSQYFSDLSYCDTLSRLCKIVDSPFACSLGRIPEYGLLSFLDNSKSNMNYVTPYEMLNLLETTSGTAATISCKHSSQTDELQKSAEDSDEQTHDELQTFKFNSSWLRERRRRDKEAFWFMRGMMDEFTHLKNFPVPVDTSLIISVCARSDGYVPRIGVSKLEDLWPGATVRYVDTGHVGAYIWYRKLFRQCIVDAFERAKLVVPPPLPEFFES